MNMNGADASAAAGLNMTKANWSYTGPALPDGRGQRAADRRRQRARPTSTWPHRAARPSQRSPQEINAFGYVQATSQAVAPYATPASAVAAGYEPVSPLTYPVTYYVNPQIVAANEAAARTLDPGAVDGLVYAQIPSGQQVLAAALYLLPSSVATAPMPYGPLVQWHQRTDVCGPTTPTATTPLQITGVTPCAAGTRPASHAVHDAWCGRCRWRAGRWRFSHRTSRSWRRPSRRAHRKLGHASSGSDRVAARASNRPGSVWSRQGREPT